MIKPRERDDDVNRVVQTGTLETKPLLYEAEVETAPPYAWAYLRQHMFLRELTTGDWVRRANEWKLIFHGDLAVDAAHLLEVGDRLLVYGASRIRLWQHKETMADWYEAELRVDSFEALKVGVYSSLSSSGMASRRPGASWAVGTTTPETADAAQMEKSWHKQAGGRGQPRRAERRPNRPPPGATRRKN